MHPAQQAQKHTPISKKYCTGYNSSMNKGYTCTHSYGMEWHVPTCVGVCACVTCLQSPISRLALCQFHCSSKRSRIYAISFDLNPQEVRIDTIKRAQLRSGFTSSRCMWSVY